MSFVRAKQIPPQTGNWYDYEVQNYRDNGRTKQRVIQYIGRSGTVKNPVLKGNSYVSDSSTPSSSSVSSSPAPN